MALLHRNYIYSYNYGGYQNTSGTASTASVGGTAGAIGICAWCYAPFGSDNPSVAIVSVSVHPTSICTNCWKMVEEYATTATGKRESREAEIGNLKNLLTFAARYVQVCHEGGDWDIIDASGDVSLDTLTRIRKALGLKDTHDFTKR